MTPVELLELFARAADAQAAALAPLVGDARRARTHRPGQYALDLVADAAVVPMLLDAGLAVVSEESGRSGPPDAAVTVVLDPVDGSTNCSRGIPYWSISLCALDADGPLCSLVVNQPARERFYAVRGGGAWFGDEPVRPSATTRVDDAVVATSTFPNRPVTWKQSRILGSAALTLCDVAAGRIDGYVDAVAHTSPWDYLGALLVCTESGALIADLDGRELVTTEVDARRAVVAAGTPELLDALRRQARP